MLATALALALCAGAGRRRAARTVPIALALALGLGAARRLTACASLLALALALGPGAGLAGGSSLHAFDMAKLRYAGAVGEQVYETGIASGTLPGSIRVHMIFAATFSGSFAIYTRGGRIDGHGRARPHGEGVYESFAGTLVVSGGTGRFRHAHGTAHLYGVFDRESYALTIQTAGTLRY
jgi:hypothetical protein